MPSKQFKLLRTMIHFNDNTQESSDRFFKIRPVIQSITEQFLKIPATPEQSVDEVMVAYKGTRAGNLRQYIQTKPDKWGYKLFCRGSIDGFIHDILMYQGEHTFTSHPTKLADNEQTMLLSSKTVIVLAKTVEDLKNTTIYADNFFSSIPLVEYLREQYGCRYVGTARENRVENPPITPSRDLNKKQVERGTLDYSSTSGILVARWKDNKVVTMVSTDSGIDPMGTVKRYDRAEKKKIDVACPDVIKKYNGRMGGIDKSDMLTHLYKTPLRARRWYIRIFGYAIDVSMCNAWLLYKRDCKEDGKQPMSLKTFRLQVSEVYRGKDTVNRKMRATRRNSVGVGTPPLPKHGQRSKQPDVKTRADVKLAHMPVAVKQRQTCKFCSTKAEVHRSRWMCTICKIALCLSESRNCFVAYHSIA